MKYEFLVGDYVETKDGRVGYITQVAFSNEVKRWCSMRIMHRQNDFIISFEGNEDLIPDRFNRIGQYDFTKKDEGKIEKIDVKKAGSVFTERETTIIDTISNKINELIEAVNELRDKND